MGWMAERKMEREMVAKAILEVRASGLEKGVKKEQWELIRKQLAKLACKGVYRTCCFRMAAAALDKLLPRPTWNEEGWYLHLEVLHRRLQGHADEKISEQLGIELSSISPKRIGLLSPPVPVESY